MVLPGRPGREGLVGVFGEGILVELHPETWGFGKLNIAVNHVKGPGGDGLSKGLQIDKVLGDEEIGNAR